MRLYNWDFFIRVMPFFMGNGAMRQFFVSDCGFKAGALGFCRFTAILQLFNAAAHASAHGGYSFQ